MKRVIVKAEPWQIFLVFIGAMIFYSVVPEQQQTVKIIASIILAVVIFGWFMILGTSLNENLPEDQQKSDTLFIISGFYGIMLVIASAVLKNVPMDESLTEFAIILIASFGLSFFYMIYFTSTLFISNQERFLDKEKLSAEATFIFFITFIFGILALQSRIRKFFA